MQRADVECLVAFLCTCKQDEMVHLPGVGWLTTKRYLAYVRGEAPGTGAAKHLPFFVASPSLFEDGLSPKPGDSFDDEGLDGKALRAVRFAWADALAAEIRSALVEARTAEVPGLGTFEIVDAPVQGSRPTRRVVRFKAALELKQRLVASA